MAIQEKERQHNNEKKKEREWQKGAISLVSTALFDSCKDEAASSFPLCSREALSKFFSF
jgi:hypothetical protein